MQAPSIFFYVALAAVFTLPAATQKVSAQPSTAVTLFQSVRIFDGKSAQLSASSFLLVRGNRIEKNLLHAHPNRSSRRLRHH